MSASSGLRNCPYCHQKWPSSEYHDLRSARWLDPLPRNITISNGDLLIHDGYHGRDRFLFLETKMPWETIIQPGQARLMTALAGQPDWTVRALRGRLPYVNLHRVTPSVVERTASVVDVAAVQARVCDWINGERWDDPKTLPDREPMGVPLSAPRPCPSCHDDHPVGTTCAGGWAPWEQSA